jgi:hypothetical protein
MLLCVAMRITDVPFHQSMPRYELVFLCGHYSSSDAPGSLRGMDYSKTALHSLRVHRHALRWDTTERPLGMNTL